MDHKLKEIIVGAFSTVNKDKEKLKSNTMRSSKFIEKIGKGIFDNLLTPIQKMNSCLYVQQVKDDGTGKISGEWLLDAVIREEFEIIDDEKKQSKSKFVKNMLWAIESESHTSLSSMAEDFGKLVVVHSENYLYLNGLNQHPNNVQGYIERRLRTIGNIIQKVGMGFPSGKLYYSFWPTPGKAQGLNSYWDTDDKDSLVRMIHLFQYEGDKFLEV